MSKVIVDKAQPGKVVVVNTGSTGPAGPAGPTGPSGSVSPAGDPGDTQLNQDDAVLGASQQGIAPEIFGVTASGSAAANNAQLLTVMSAFGGARGDFAFSLPSKTFTTEGFSRSLTPGTERWPYGLSVMGKGPTSVFQLAPDSVPDSNQLFLFENTSSARTRETALQNFQVKGTASGHYGAGGGSDQNAIEIGYLGSDGGSRFLIFGVTGYRLKGRAVSVAAADGLSFGPRITNVLAEDCLYGFYVAHPASLMGNQAIYCNTGIRVNGNVSDIGSTYQNCNTAHAAIGGGNDAHDLSLGNRYVHNGIAFDVGTLTNGKLISDCLVYEGAVNFAAGGAVVSINGGQWDATTYGLLGASVWRGVDFATGYSGVITIGASSQNEFMRDCRDMTGNVPAMIGDYIDNTFAFAANANETLTAQKSVAQYLTISDGAAATARQITSTLLPRKGTRREFYNSGSFDHTFKFATGGIVTLKAGQRTVVGADGTNATIQSNPLIAGANVTLTPSAAGVTIASTGGGGGAPTTATYVTLTTDATLTNERALAAGSVITLTDGGAGGNITVGVTAGTDGQVLGNVSGTNTWGNVAAYFGLGTGTKATSGLLRIASQTVDIIRGKLASTVEKAILSVNTADEIQLGSDTNWTTRVYGNLLALWGGAAGFEMYSGAAGFATLRGDGTNLKVGLPMSGWASSNLMMRWKTQAMSFSTLADYTVSNSEYEAPIWIITDSGGGPGSGTKNLIAPAQAGAVVIIINRMTATYVALKDASGSAATTSVAIGEVGFFVHDGTDWENVALPTT